MPQCKHSWKSWKRRFIFFLPKNRPNCQLKLKSQATWLYLLMSLGDGPHVVLSWCQTEALRKKIVTLSTVHKWRMTKENIDHNSQFPQRTGVYGFLKSTEEPCGSFYRHLQQYRIKGWVTSYHSSQRQQKLEPLRTEAACPVFQSSLQHHFQCHLMKRNQLGAAAWLKPQQSWKHPPHYRRK